jgi:hypothetical protein
MEPDCSARDERLTIIAVELPDVMVTGTRGAPHRARCVLLDESKQAAPLQPGDVVIVRSMNSGLAAVERVTAGRPDGCWYVLLEFRLTLSRHNSPAQKLHQCFSSTSVRIEADRLNSI